MAIHQVMTVLSGTLQDTSVQGGWTQQRAGGQECSAAPVAAAAREVGARWWLPSAQSLTLLAPSIVHASLVLSALEVLSTACTPLMQLQPSQRVIMMWPPTRQLIWPLFGSTISGVQAFQGMKAWSHSHRSCSIRASRLAALLRCLSNSSSIWGKVVLSEMDCTEMKWLARFSSASACALCRMAAEP